MGTPRLLHRILLLAKDSPLLWMLVTFCAYHHYAQFVASTRWNAIELIIAQHLIDHGAYVTSLDYPSALTWRPLLPTLLVTLVRLGFASPITIYQIVCGTTLAILAATMFLSARAVWGTLAGHAAAFLTFFCPALTSALINHSHSYSHLGALIFLGLAVWPSVVVLARNFAHGPAPAGWYAGAGVAWGLAAWCRSELLLFGGVFIAVVVMRHWRRRGQWLRPVAAAAALLVVVLPYQWLLARVAEREGILVRKPIYTMYMSQGWLDVGPDARGDVEGAGYIYAKKLYGDPVEHGESLIRAALSNPGVFAERLRINARKFYERYVSANFVPWWWTAAALGMASWSLAGRTARRDRMVVLFLAGLFAASHFVLIFHIDERYLTINMPVLILLGAGAVASLWRLADPLGVWSRVGLATAMLGGVAYLFGGHLQNFRIHGPRNETSQTAMRSLGEHFRSTVQEPILGENREPHIGFVAPVQSPLYPEDAYLLPYYSRTAWVFGGAEGEFPRGRFYSYRNCEDDYRYVPEEALRERNIAGFHVIADYENPVLGRYYLLERIRLPGE